jgi:hypothetical protein
LRLTHTQHLNAGAALLSQHTSQQGAHCAHRITPAGNSVSQSALQCLEETTQTRTIWVGSQQGAPCGECCEGVQPDTNQQSGPATHLLKHQTSSISCAKQDRPAPLGVLKSAVDKLRAHVGATPHRHHCQHPDGTLLLMLRGRADAAGTPSATAAAWQMAPSSCLCVHLAPLPAQAPGSDCCWACCCHATLECRCATLPVRRAPWLLLLLHLVPTHMGLQ